MEIPKNTDVQGLTQGTLKLLSLKVERGAKNLYLEKEKKKKKHFPGVVLGTAELRRGWN